MNPRNVLWWALFLPLSLVIQVSLPGLDAMVIGLILILQERGYKNLLWLLPALILVQEGIGSREFGGMVLWYALVVGLFFLGRWLFEVESMLFVLLLSVCLGAGHFLLAHVLAPLQDLTVDVQAIGYESLAQALFLPAAWRLARLSRRWVCAYEEDA